MTSTTEVTAAVAAALAAPRCRHCGRPMDDRFCTYGSDGHRAMSPEVQASIDALIEQAVRLRDQWETATSRASGNDTATNHKGSRDSSAVRKARAAYKTVIDSIEALHRAVGYEGVMYLTQIDELYKAHRAAADAAWRKRMRLAEAAHMRERAAETTSPDLAAACTARAELLEQLAADDAPDDENDGA